MMKLSRTEKMEESLFSPVVQTGRHTDVVEEDQMLNQFTQTHSPRVRTHGHWRKHDQKKNFMFDQIMVKSFLYSLLEMIFLPCIFEIIG